MSINRVSLSGNLTRDPELRSTTSGSQVLSFGIAVNDRRRNAQGEWEDVPNYVDCVVFGARAESLSRFLAKGQKIVLEGKLRWSQWERDGQKRSKLEVIVDNLDFFSQRRQSGAEGSGYQQPYGTQMPMQQSVPVAAPTPYTQAPATGGYQEPQQPAQTSVPEPPAADVYDEEIPF